MGIEAAIFRTGSDLEDLVASELARNPGDAAQALRRVEDAVELCEKVRELGDACSKRRAAMRELGARIRAARNPKNDAEEKDVESLLDELKALKAEAKAREKELKEVEAGADAAVARFGNLVDHDNDAVVDSASVLGFDDKTISAPDDGIPISAEDALRTCFGRLTPSLSRLEDLKGRWLDETVELPMRFFDSTRQRLVIVCKGEARWSSSAALACAQRLGQIMNDSAALAPVPAARLGLADASAIEVQDAASKPLAMVRNTTDFVSRALGIRSGAKKHLQVSKKFVHVVTVQIFAEDSRVAACGADLDLCPAPIARALNADALLPERFLGDEAESEDKEDSVSARVLELLEFWLRRNTFVGGAAYSRLDARAQALVRPLRAELCGVQYPGVMRWLKLLD